ncbi:MAG: choice-of-anchor tandem repeat GloVer-containing protein [Bacteroidota bacterium]
MKKIILIISVTLFSSSLLFAQAPSLWGICGWGGAQNWGTIIKADSTGTNFHSVYEFDNTNGAQPLGKLCLANNGKLYGVTWLGGFGDSCVCFEYDTATNVYTKFYDLYYDQTQGYGAQSGMLNCSNGFLYGLCPSGGLNLGGVIYKIDPSTDTYTPVFNFMGQTGISPQGSLTENDNGNLYGMTYQGGTKGCGTIFSYNPNSNFFSKLYDFDTATGSSPYFGNLVNGANDFLYGMTRLGGANNLGVIFSINISDNSYSDLFDFDSINGSFPMGGLIQADNGKLYGMTNSGGVFNLGILFSYDVISENFIKLYDFDTLSGGFPKRSLTQTSNGMLYGTTSSGGIHGCGTAFAYDILTNNFIDIFDFDGVNGCYPDCEILETGARTIPHTTNNISEINSTEIKIFPSPASKEISITGNSISVNDIVTVTDVTGREVLQQKTAQSQHVNLNVSSLFPGVYFTEIKMQKGSAVKRFVKE